MTTYTKEQQAQHRRLWVEALRSGKFKQGTKVLRSPQMGMCCLGVACDISGLVSWSAEPEDRGLPAAGYVAIVNGDHISRIYAPDAVADWLGLSDDKGSYGTGDVTLAQDNDSGKSFAEIADIIESEPPGLIT